ncbi:hypothetical protein Tco_1169242, partial [Tanacetum coccineum]
MKISESFLQVYYGAALIFFSIGLGSGVSGMPSNVYISVWHNSIISHCVDKKDDAEAYLVSNVTYMMGSLKRLDWANFIAATSLWFNSSYKHDNGFVFVDISIGADIQNYVGISSWAENLRRV